MSLFITTISLGEVEGKPNPALPLGAQFSKCPSARGAKIQLGSSLVAKASGRTIIETSWVGALSAPCRPPPALPHATAWIKELGFGLATRLLASIPLQMPIPH